MDLQIKRLRTARGNETDAFSLDLVCDGKVVAEVQNDGWGGGHHIMWKQNVTQPQRDAITAYAQARAIEHEVANEAAERALNPSAAKRKNGIEWGWYVEHLRAKPHDGLEDWITTAIDLDKIQKRLARAMKKSTLFRLKGDDALAWRSLSAAYSPQTVAQIQKKYGAKLACVLNEIPVEQCAARVMRAEAA